MSESPPTQPIIRRAVLDDVAALVPFARQSFFDAYCEIDDHDAIHDHSARHFTHERLAQAVLDPKTAVLLAHDDALAGYALVTESEPPACIEGPAPIELVRLYLAKDRIGRGLGARLMREVVDEALRRGGRTLWLGVYDRNERAIGFYQRFGMRIVGTKSFEWAGAVVEDPVMAVDIRR
jgi:ribosomal protein S18 acetylase RimI-like enzyme